MSKGWAIKTPADEILPATFCSNVKSYEERCQTNSWINYTVICHREGYKYNTLKTAKEKAGYSCVKVTVKEGWDEEG